MGNPDEVKRLLNTMQVSMNKLLTEVGEWAENVDNVPEYELRSGVVASTYGLLGALRGLETTFRGIEKTVTKTKG